ncbi:DUF551 domain-containing protein [Klebsiella pneumoniae]|uniref:DUF551 domain-containing protein n=1 Tax=Klebsiella pneumoniae TaxID=573 RepID=UPI001651215D|nr:DUF551 domain-containing protein [Klebsiella pneumoniae]MDM6843485.1 DUF551 domain-containing protein [Klebsiella pneumoniae]HDS4235631.1 DUF551 domain-containing protein [Klebsiella pneumoniae subsp. pneumoniae]HDU4865037.1 DUF551 domain-containing protein [Klebsiella pneumoniae subsp. pneumoniae]
MTSKFSIDNRELLQRISSGEAIVGIDFGNLIVRELAAFRLSAMDSEPDCKERKLFCSTDTTRMRKTISVSAGTEDAPLYRHAQPAPVVPELMVDWQENEFSAGWNACRAAMLAAAPQSPGSEPATVPGKWIPVSERLPEDSGRYWCYVEEQNDLGKSHYQWNCSWNGDRWWVESEGGGIVTHWMPLPAGPQEVR